jgi:pyruvate carboxylase subunit B
MKKEIKFSLLFRDMWQSAGKYVPRVDQLVKVAPAIIEMGCFARVETNGGGFEQVNLLFGENPNKAYATGQNLFRRQEYKHIC